MKFKFVYKGLFYFFMTSTTLLGDDSLLLKKQEIPQIMDEIFSQHAEKKKMTAALIQNSIKIYLEQFDPYHTYLLEDEVIPFLHPKKEESEAFLKEYENNQYTVYEKLENLIEKAILRSRKIRKELETNELPNFEHRLHVDIQSLQNLLYTKNFAKNEEELKKRIFNQFMILFQVEKKRYGEAYLKANGQGIAKTYEKRLRSFEKQYLLEENPNKKAEDENLFVTHILKSLAASLDAHTEFYSKEEAHEMKLHLENSFQGVGINLQDTPEGIAIVGLVPGSPAAKSGLIFVNDELVTIDGKSVLEDEVDKVANALQGKTGSFITLGLKRKLREGSLIVDKEVTVTLKREQMTIDEDRVISSFEQFGNGLIGKIKLNSFYQSEGGITSEKDVREALIKLEKSGDLRGVVFDLRDNTGGFLSQAVKVAGLFITNGVIVISKYSDGEEKIFRDVDGKTTFTGPLVILTSKMTASAAEIVAEALQDYGVALIVGDAHTFGKGTVQSQTVTQDKGSSFFKVTIGKYYTVSGKTPQINGVIADVVVPGKYSHDKVGEAYLDSHTLKNDRIAPLFDDKLEGVDPSEKSWYQHHYVPTEQQKVGMWREMLPVLKKKSDARISSNKNYQLFLSNLKEGEGDSLSKNSSKGESQDFQMIEAVNILKDMIELESKLKPEQKK